MHEVIKSSLEALKNNQAKYRETHANYLADVIKGVPKIHHGVCFVLTHNHGDKEYVMHKGLEPLFKFKKPGIDYVNAGNNGTLTYNLTPLEFVDIELIEDGFILLDGERKFPLYAVCKLVLNGITVIEPTVYSSSDFAEEYFKLMEASHENMFKTNNKVATLFA